MGIMEDFEYGPPGQEQESVFDDISEDYTTSYDNPDVEPQESEESDVSFPADAPYSIEIDTKQPTVSNILDKLQHDEITLSPEFQRRDNLWNSERQSRLIESLVLQIPLPAFYFDVDKLDGNAGGPPFHWTVVDGLQRLCAIRNFLSPDSNGQYTHRFHSMEYLTQYNGKTFGDLPSAFQRIVLQTQLVVYLIKPSTREDVKFNIFRRVNTGGLPLSQQEIRHALNQGKPAHFLMRLADSSAFKKATQNRISPKRMLDREFVNRFLAFYLQDLNDYHDLDSYMNRVLKKINKLSEAKLNAVFTEFEQALACLTRAFGDDVFSRTDVNGSDRRKPPVNKVLFEVMTVSVAQLGAEKRQQLLNLGRDVTRSKYRRLLKNTQADSFYDLIGTSTGRKSRVLSRYKVVNEFLWELIHV